MAKEPSIFDRVYLTDLPGVTRLVLVRHGQSHGNVERRLDTRPPGTPTIRGISSMATRQVLADLTAAYECSAGLAPGAIAIESVGGVDAARRVAAGEAFDPTPANLEARTERLTLASGMKVALNGGLNLSVLDGWWAELYDNEVGWSLPSQQWIDDLDARDAARDHEGRARGDHPGPERHPSQGQRPHRRHRRRPRVGRRASGGGGLETGGATGGTAWLIESSCAA